MLVHLILKFIHSWHPRKHLLSLSLLIHLGLHVVNYHENIND